MIPSERQLAKQSRHKSFISDIRLKFMLCYECFLSQMFHSKLRVNKPQRTERNSRAISKDFGHFKQLQCGKSFRMEESIKTIKRDFLRGLPIQKIEFGVSVIW